MTATLGHTVAKAFLPLWCHRILKDREPRFFFCGVVLLGFAVLFMIFCFKENRY